MQAWTQKCVTGTCDTWRPAALWNADSSLSFLPAIREMTPWVVPVECWLLSNCQNWDLITVKGCATEDGEGTSGNLQCPSVMDSLEERGKGKKEREIGRWPGLSVQWLYQQRSTHRGKGIGGSVGGWHREGGKGRASFLLGTKAILGRTLLHAQLGDSRGIAPP